MSHDANSSDPVFDRRRRSRLFRTPVRHEVDDELKFHLEMRTRDHERAGLSPREARTRARREFGDVDDVRRMCRALGKERDVRMGRAQYFDEIRQDAMFAWRQFRAAPGFAVVALLTLALGLGGTTAIFSLVRGVLLRPLPYTDADRLVVVRVSMPDHRDLRAGVPALSHLAIWASNLETLTGPDEPEQILAGVISPDLFDTLGVRPLMGRGFTEADGASRLVVLGHGLWQRRFAAARDIIGRTIEISRQPAVVVGVMPPQFEFPSREFALWMPLAHVLARTPEQRENRAFRIFRAVGRLADGATLARAQGQVDLVSARLAKEYPSTNAGVEPRLQPLYEQLVGPSRQPLLVLFGVVTLVLLIACLNVAHLLVARAATREREMAVRAALGAGRGRLVRQVLTESVLLALCGGVLGVVAARATLDALVRLLSPIVPRVEGIAIDGGVLMAATLAAALTGIGFGTIPAFQQRARASSLREGRGLIGRASGRALRGALIAFEVALSVLVLVGAGLLLRSLQAVAHVDPGFVAERLLTMTVPLIDMGAGPARAEAVRLLTEQVSAMPGVEAVGAGSALPPETAQRSTTFEAEGVTAVEGPRPSTLFITVSPDYFRALGTPVRVGRAFDARDAAGAPPVVIVSEGLARDLYPQGSAIGRRVRLVNPEQSDVWRTIVGVVPDVRYQGLEEESDATLYTPVAQTPFLWTYLFVRTAGDPAAMVRPVAQAVAKTHPNLQASRIRPMETLVLQAVAARRASALLLTGFAALALILAAIGIGGLVSHAVSRRAPEMALRLALGATPSGVLAMVLRHSLTPVALGAVCGLLAAVAATRLIESLLFGVASLDPWTFAAVISVLACVSVLAAIVPARRALVIQPSDALRGE